jgi:5'-3' exonuclease
MSDLSEPADRQLRILAVDVSGVCRAQWEMYQSGRLSDGEAFANSVAKITKAADGHDRVVLALDVGPSFRKLHCPTYKANRPDPGEAYRKMVRDVVERLQKDGAMAFPNRGEMGKIAQSLPSTSDASAPFFYPEADDIIASLVAWYHRQNPGDWALTILSGDTDVWALVDDATKVAVLRLQDGVLITETQVRERFEGVGDWIAEVKALGGDDGDGYKPFPHYVPVKKGGIAEGKAARLLQLAGPTAQDVLNAAIAGTDWSDNHERRCILAGGQAALDMGYACARMLSDLPLCFERILAEPKVQPLTEERRPEAHPAPLSIPTSAHVQQESTAMTVSYSSRIDRYALQPRDTDTLWNRAEMIYNSRMFPRFKSQAAIATGIVILQEMGYGMSALRHLYDVNGTLGFSAMLLVATVRRSKTCKRFELISGPQDDTAVVEYQRATMEKPAKYPFTEQMAQKLNSQGEPWKKSRHVMKAWAAMRECARLHWPELVGGLYTPDEIRGGLTDEEFISEARAMEELP